jgi:hypothetical protein
VSAEIRTEHIPNMDQELRSNANPLGDVMCTEEHNTEPRQSCFCAGNTLASNIFGLTLRGHAVA